VVKEMNYRKVKQMFLAHGCTAEPGKGDHEKWTCPCGKHIAVVIKPGDVSPGLIRQAIQRMPCLPKGWLQ
jgi:hypothetical protein